MTSARRSPVSTFCLILTLLTSLATSTSKVVCPTITKTTSHAYCPPPTPSVCAHPECEILSVIDIPCGCPTTVPTCTSYTACPTVCHGTCGTAYRTNLDCPTTTTNPPTTLATTTTTSNTCVTITQTTGSTCPLNTCAQPQCVLAKTVTLSCRCSSIFTKTQCPTACGGGCKTQYQTAAEPCAFTGTM